MLSTGGGDDEFGLGKAVNLGQVKVFSIRDDGGQVLTSPVCRELRHLQVALTQHFLRSHDIQVQEVRVHQCRRSWYPSATGKGTQVHEVRVYY